MNGTSSRKADKIQSRKKIEHWYRGEIDSKTIIKKHKKEFNKINRRINKKELDTE